MNEKPVKFKKTQNNCWGLPDCAKIQGIIPLIFDGAPEESCVYVQYTDSDDEWFEVKMSLSAFFYLRDLTEQFVQTLKLEGRIKDPMDN